MGLMRELGLIVHHLVAPVARTPAPRIVEQRRQVEEQQVNPRLTLRRTVIEEIEICPAPSGAVPPAEGSAPGPQA